MGQPSSFVLEYIILVFFSNAKVATLLHFVNQVSNLFISGFFSRIRECGGYICRWYNYSIVALLGKNAGISAVTWNILTISFLMEAGFFHKSNKVEYAGSILQKFHAEIQNLYQIIANRRTRALLTCIPNDNFRCLFLATTLSNWWEAQLTLRWTDRAKIFTYYSQHQCEEAQKRSST